MGIAIWPKAAENCDVPHHKPADSRGKRPQY